MPVERVNDTDLFYQDDDFADPWLPHDTVFLQHGFGRNSNFWRAWVPWFARRYRVIRLDLRGCGRSADPGPGYRFDLDQAVADFTGFLEARELGAVHYIGESLGGVIGVNAAARHPERFKSLTLVSTPLRLRQETPAHSKFQLDYPTWQDALRDLGLKEWWLRARAATNELTGDPARDEWLASEFARTPVEVAVAMSEAVPGVSLEELLPRVTVPVLMLSPGTSWVTTTEEQARLAELLPNVVQRTYPGANHSMYHQIPDLLAADTLTFLSNLPVG